MATAEQLGAGLAPSQRTDRVISAPVAASTPSGPAVVRHAISPRWSILPVLVGLLGIASRQPGLTMAGTIVLLALAATLIWGRWALAGVECRQFITPMTAHFGDEVLLTLEVINRKALPLPWLEYVDRFPDLLKLGKRGVLTQHALSELGSELRSLVTLRWYERVSRRYSVICSARGEHTIGPLTVRAGDLFGLTTRTLEIESRATVLVYPRLVTVTELGLPANYPLGELRARQALHRNPLDVAGVRPYLHGDTLRDVHWRATARAGALQVKVHEPATTLRALLLLNVHTMPKAWDGIRTELLELAISGAASVAADLLLRRWEVGLATNAQARHTLGRLRVPAGAGPDQLAALLTSLARINAAASFPFPEVVDTEATALRSGTTVIVVTVVLGARLLDSLRALALAGSSVLLLLVGAEHQTVTSLDTGLPTRWLGDEQRWSELVVDRAASAISRGELPVGTAVAGPGAAC